MDIKTKSGSTKFRRNKTETIHFENVISVCKFLAKNADTKLAGLAQMASEALFSLHEALISHEKDAPAEPVAAGKK